MDGRVNILGERFVMLPVEITNAIEYDNDKARDSAKEMMDAFIKKIGSNKAGLIDNLVDIYGIFGLGKLSVNTLDIAKGSGDFIITCISSEKKLMQLSVSFLEGVLSSIYGKNINAKAKFDKGIIHIQTKAG